MANEAYLLEHTEEYDMSSAQPTVMRWVCAMLGVHGTFDCDHERFAAEDFKRRSQVTLRHAAGRAKRKRGEEHPVTVFA